MNEAKSDLATDKKKQHSNLLEIVAPTTFSSEMPTPKQLTKRLLTIVIELLFVIDKQLVVVLEKVFSIFFSVTGEADPTNAPPLSLSTAPSMTRLFFALQLTSCARAHDQQPHQHSANKTNVIVCWASVFVRSFGDHAVDDGERWKRDAADGKRHRFVFEANVDRRAALVRLETRRQFRPLR